jgi:putative transposase
VSIDSFIVMPNHVHAIVVIDGQHRHSPDSEIRIEPALSNGLVLVPPKAGSLSAIVRSYKAGVTRRCHEMGLRNFAWQAGFYDHIVRANASLKVIRDYIEKNPANWPSDPENRL